MASNNAVHPSPTPKEEEEEVLDLTLEDEDAAKERQIEITPYEMQAPAVQVACPEANGDKADEEDQRSGRPRLFSKEVLQVPKVYFNVLKKNINNSMFFPRKLTPAFIRMKKDPLRDLQIWERICYILLSIHVALLMFSIMMVINDGRMTDTPSPPPFNPNDSDFARPLCTHYSDDLGYFRMDKTRLQEDYQTDSYNSLFGFTVTSGECTLDRDGFDGIPSTCFRSPNYPSDYLDNQQCSIYVALPMTLSVTTFSTERFSDYITVNGNDYSGTAGPDGVEVAGGATITFTSDSNYYGSTRAGFEICAQISDSDYYDWFTTGDRLRWLDLVDTDCMRKHDIDGTQLTLAERQMEYDIEKRGHDMVAEWTLSKVEAAFSFIIKFLVSDPILALFLATKGRKELAKTDKCYMWCGWGLAALPFTILFIYLGIGAAWSLEGAILNDELLNDNGWVLGLLESCGLAVGEEDLNNHTFWVVYSDTVANFVIAELTTPFFSPGLAWDLARWLLIPAKPLPWCCYCMLPIYFYYYMFYPLLWFFIWMLHIISFGLVSHPKEFFKKSKSTLNKQWLKYAFIEDEMVQDPDLEEKTGGLFGPLESICCMASAYCASTHLEDDA